jgi:translation initiation factor 2 subunit 1
MAEAKAAPRGRAYDWPDEGELVVSTVTNVKNFGAFVTLDEYSNKEGFVHIAEVSSGWIKYIRDYIREGQKVVCKVLKVDKEKGHIDLSLKAVNEHQRREKIQEWKNEQKAENLLTIVSQRLGKTVEASWEEFGYDLLDSFGTLYRAFEESVMDERALEDEGFKGPWVKAFVEVARENIIPPHVSIDGYLEATDPCPDGAVHLKEALQKAVQESDGMTVKVQYIGAPRYRVVVRAPDYKTAEEEIQKAAGRVIKALTAKGGEAKFHRKE